MSDSNNGVQGPAGTSAGVRNRHARKRDLIDSNASCSESSDSDPENILSAARYWERKDEAKSDGCMAAKLRCSVWASAQSPGTMTLSLVKGWTRFSHPKRNDTQPCERMDALQPSKAQ